VLAWIFRRCDDQAQAERTPIGFVPTPEHLELDGLDRDRVAEALTVDLDEARAELEQTEAHLAKFGDDLPAEVRFQFKALQARLVD
jgi:phosphoenolpyruvate carboxykinase (GTP)